MFESCRDTHLEGAVGLSYLVSCRVETGASHPGLATGMEGCCFLGSLEGLGCLAQGNEGSFPPVWAATFKTID